MSTFKLDQNQAALILTLDTNGEMFVDVIGQEMPSLSKEICEAIALKLINESDFQDEVLVWTSDVPVEAAPTCDTLESATTQKYLKHR